MSKHTEGLWHYEYNDKNGAYYVVHEGTVCDATAICKIECYRMDEEIEIANAKLIAKAPEMYKALERISMMKLPAMLDAPDYYFYQIKKMAEKFIPKLDDLPDVPTQEDLK